ncbi:MAG: hypothetical protein IPQ09_02440 [Myxococcales bacterium]|nr:hypothetical protein [Myxococcales bacterium]
MEPHGGGRPELLPVAGPGLPHELLGRDEPDRLLRARADPPPGRRRGSAGGLRRHEGARRGVDRGRVWRACQKSGNTVSLPGHPEAVVTYVNSDGTDSASTSTQQNGLAWIRGITPGAPVKPAFVSGVAGCTPNLAFSTGNVKLAADSVSVLNVEMKP